MRIAIGNDHRGSELKFNIVRFLESEGHTALNFGCDSTESVDYPDFAALVSKSVTDRQAEMGILICATGIGMSITANKRRDIRAALCCTPLMATRARQHNNANILCLGADFLDTATALEIVHNFTTTNFEGGRHQRRLDKIAKMECSSLDNK